MSDVVGQVGVEVQPDLSSFADALTSALGPALSDGVGEVQSAMTDVTASAQDAGTAITDDLGGSFLGLGDIIKGVAIGELIAGAVTEGVSVALDKLHELGDFFAGGDMQKDINQIRVDTGATGEALGSLVDSMHVVATSTVVSLGGATDAVVGVNAKLGLTGTQLETVSTSIARLSSLTGTSIQSNIKSLTGVFNNFNVAAQDQAGDIDVLFRVFQKTQVPVDQLASQMSRVGPLARQAGLDFNQTASFVGLLGKAGLNGQMGMQAFAKILAQSKKDGVDAATGFKNLFDGISSGTIKFTDSANIFTGRAAGMFDLIKTGKLNYEDFAKSVANGGDTLAQAAGDTRTWQGQLKMLTNQLQIDLEPIANEVFGFITQAVITLRPLIAGLADIVVNWLTPAWKNLGGVLSPVVTFFDKVRDGLSAAVGAIKEGQGPLDAFRAFFVGLGDDLPVAQALTDRMAAFGQVMSDAWAALQPVRDGIEHIFGVIQKAVVDFVSQNPGAVFAGLAAVVGGALVAAVVALAGVLLPLVATFAAFVVGVLAVPLAIAAVVAGLVWLYNNFQSVRDGVQTAWDLLQGLGAWLADTMVKAWDDVSAAVQPWIGYLEYLGQGLIDDVTNGLSGLFTAIDGIIHLDFGTVSAGIDQWSSALLDAVARVGPELLKSAMGIGENLINNLVNGLQSVPFAAPFITYLESGIDAVRQGISGALDIFSGILTLDPGKIESGVRQMADGLVQVITTVLPSALGGLGDIISGPLYDMLNSGLTGLVDKIKDIPVIGPIAEGLKSMIVQAVHNIGDISTILSGIFSLDPSKIVSGLGSLAGSLKDGLAGVLGQLPRLLGDVLGGLAEGAATVFTDWLPKVVTAAGDGIQTGLKDAFSFLKNLPTILGGLIEEYGPEVGKDIVLGILGGLKFALFDLPKWIITEMIPTVYNAIVTDFPKVFDAIKTVVSKLPEILGSVLSSLGGVLLTVLSGLLGILTSWPAQILAGIWSAVQQIPAGLAALGSLIGEALTAAWNWVVDNGPGILANVANWLAGLPGQVVGWLGDLGSMLAGWWLAGFDWVVSNGLTLLGNLISWVAQIPYQLFQMWSGLGSMIAGLVVDAFNWIVTNGPTILVSIGDWVTSLPGKILGWLGDLGGLLVGWVKGAFDWIVTNGPTLLEGLINWFSGLPGRIFDAIRSGLSSVGGAVTNIASDIWDAVKGFVNDHLITPVHNFKVDLGFWSGHPFEGIPYLAGGGITSGPTMAVIGDNPGGREAVIPLNDPAKAAAMADAAGIRRGGGGGDQYIEVSVVIQATPDTTPEKVREVVQTAGAEIRSALPEAFRKG
jgi:TP901 family phage tail tape measure protein